MKLFVKSLVIFVPITLLVWSFKTKVGTVEIRHDCEMYVFSETGSPGTYFLFDNEFSTSSKEYLRNEGGPKNKKTQCPQTKKHFASIENWGPEFQGAFLTGPEQSYILHTNNLPFDPLVKDWENRIAVYNEHLPSLTFYIYRGVVTELFQSPENQVDYQLFCRDLSALYSLRSNMGIGDDIGVFKEAITGMVANCEGEITFSLKSTTDPEVAIEDVNLLYKDVYSDYYGGGEDDRVQGGIDAYFNSKPKPAEDAECPVTFEITSNKGICFHFTGE